MVHSQIVSNFERAWEITGRSEDELTGVMVQISQVVSQQFKAEDRRLLVRLRPPYSGRHGVSCVFLTSQDLERHFALKTAY